MRILKTKRKQTKYYTKELYILFWFLFKKKCHRTRFIQRERERKRAKINYCNEIDNQFQLIKHLFFLISSKFDCISVPYFNDSMNYLPLMHFVRWFSFYSELNAKRFTTIFTFFLFFLIHPFCIFHVKTNNTETAKRFM